MPKKNKISSTDKVNILGKNIPGNTDILRYRYFSDFSEEVRATGIPLFFKIAYFSNLKGSLRWQE